MIANFQGKESKAAPLESSSDPLTAVKHATVSPVGVKSAVAYATRIPGRLGARRTQHSNRQ